MDKSELSAALESQWLGRRFEIHQSIESTNTRLTKMAKEQAPAGTMVLSEYQSLGKGRLGRRWDAPAGSSLLFSLLFRPNWPVDRAQWLMMIAGLSAIEAIRAATKLEVRLKWPNDIVIGDVSDWRKCGGILLEGEISGSSFISAIVGMGINVNIPPSDLANTAINATSLEAEAGYTLPRTPLLVDILRIMELRYEQTSAGQSPLAEWRSALINLGQKVRVSSTSGGSPVEGTAVDTDEMGRLLIRDNTGKISKMAAGDVTVLS